MEQNNLTFQCLECSKQFSSKKTLTYHMRSIHEVAVHFKSEESFLCPHCGKSYRHKQSFNRHIRQNHPSDDDEALLSSSSTGNDTGRASRICCPQDLCETYFSQYRYLYSHLADVHQISVSYQELQFKTQYDFESWKEEMEEETLASFVKSRGLQTTTKSTRNYYHCNRSYSYVSQSQNIRTPKSLGTNKMGKACPARIIASFHDTAIHVAFWGTHVGHTHDVGRLRISKTFKSTIAAKLKNGVTLDRILDDIRDSGINTLDRNKIITKQDLYNIEAQFHIHDDIVRHQNDMVSVGLWVHEMLTLEHSPVLFYKGINSNVSGFDDGDFILVLMTQYQFMLLQQFSSNKICIDGTHGTNAYNILLYTLVVIDEYGSGCPVAHCLSNRQDEKVFIRFFTCIKDKLGSIQSKVFMSDDAPAFYNAWSSVMGKPDHKLLCTWHVDRCWRKNLVKVKDEVKRALVYENLTDLLHLTDVELFHTRLETFITDTFNDEDTKLFASYFKKNYINKVESWAYSYRLRLGITTNMYLESFHKILKYFYLEGKCSKRLDKTIHALIKYTRDASLNRLTRLLKNTPNSKVRLVRKSHIIGTNIDPTHITALKANVWNVQSQTDPSKLYEVTRTGDACSTPCMTCIKCNICIHSYMCSCVDNSISMSICKHIHACAQKHMSLNSVNNLNAILQPVADEIIISSAMDAECRQGGGDVTSGEDLLSALRNKLAVVSEIISVDNAPQVENIINELLRVISINGNGTAINVKKNIIPQKRY